PRIFEVQSPDHAESAVSLAYGVRRRSQQEEHTAALDSPISDFRLQISDLQSAIGNLKSAIGQYSPLPGKRYHRDGVAGQQRVVLRIVELGHAPPLAVGGIDGLLNIDDLGYQLPFHLRLARHGPEEDPVANAADGEGAVGSKSRAGGRSPLAGNELTAFMATSLINAPELESSIRATGSQDELVVRAKQREVAELACLRRVLKDALSDAVW